MKVYLLIGEDAWSDRPEVCGIFSEEGKKKKEREFLKPGYECLRKKMLERERTLMNSEETFRVRKEAFEKAKASKESTEDCISAAKIAMLQAEESFEIYKRKCRTPFNPSDEEAIACGLDHPDGDSYSNIRYWFDEYELND